MTIAITYEDIARRAYEIYLRNGSHPGHEIENWLRAEGELKRELSLQGPEPQVASIKPVRLKNAPPFPGLAKASLRGHKNGWQTAPMPAAKRN